MDLEKIKKGTVLVSKGNGERLKVKGFKATEDKQIYLTVKPYDEDALGYRKEYDIILSLVEMHFEIEGTR